MKTVTVRELRSAIPRLAQTLAEEHELVLVSNGEPITRILPVDTQPPKLESLEWLRAMVPPQSDSTALVREERDRRGS